MSPFTLLYLLYCAKLSSQASTYFIWLVDSSSKTIAFIAAAVAVLSAVPFFHVMIHVFSAKPLSNAIFIAYLSFSLLLAILWYNPTKDGKQRVLPFAVVTAFDLLDLLIFLFQQQIGHWHNIISSDIEQGHLKAETRDDASVALGGENEQVHHGDLSPRPPQNKIRGHRVLQELGNDINTITRSGRAIGDSSDFDPRSAGEQAGMHDPDGRGFGQTLDDREADVRSARAKIALKRSGSVGWGSGMLQTSHEREVGEEHSNLSSQRQSGFFIDLGEGAGSQFENPSLLRTPTDIIFSDIHPVYRPTSDNESRMSVRIFERNQI